MSGTVIVTKFSLTNAQPASNALAQGEQAYSFISDKLWVGWDNNGVIDPIAIGGKYYTDLMPSTSATHGNVVASTAIVTDSNNKIDLINIDNITIDGNTISTTNTNGDLIVSPNGSGDIDLQGNTNVVGNLTVSGTQTFTGQATFSSVNVTDLTSGRVLLAGTSGELEDSASLTFNGTDLSTVNVSASGTLDVTGQTTLASAAVSDLTATRLTFAGAAGELTDSASLTFNGTTLVASNISTGGTLDVTGQTTLASAAISDLTSGRVTYAGIGGELTDSGNMTFDGTTLSVSGAIAVDSLRLDSDTISATAANGDITLTPNGTGLLIVDSTEAMVIAGGSEASRPTPLAVGDGAIRYNTTDNRFEGTVSGAWTGLGGVVDIDQDTYITAEATADDDTLTFVAAGTTEMTVDASGVNVTDQITTPIANITTSNETTANIGTANVTTALTVSTASVDFQNGIDVTNGNVDITDNLNVDGNAVIGGNLTVNGTTTTVNSTVTELTDPVIQVGAGSLAAGDANDRGVNFEYGDGAPVTPAVQTGFFGMDMQTSRFSFKPIVDIADENYVAPWGDAQFGNLYLSADLEVASNLTLSANSITTTAGDLTITPAGGDTTITGTLDVTGALSADSLTLTNDLAVTEGGTGLNSFPGDAIFISNAAGTAMGFITAPVSNPEDYIIKFNSSGVPVSSNVIDGGTF